MRTRFWSRAYLLPLLHQGYSSVLSRTPSLNSRKSLAFLHTSEISANSGSLGGTHGRGPAFAGAVRPRPSLPSPLATNAAPPPFALLRSSPTRLRAQIRSSRSQPTALELKVVTVTETTEGEDPYEAHGVHKRPARDLDMDGAMTP